MLVELVVVYEVRGERWPIFNLVVSVGARMNTVQ